jgi:hypothetical protein
LQSFWDSSAGGRGDGDGDGHGGGGDLLPHDLSTTIPEAETRCCSFVSGDSTRPFQRALTTLAHHLLIITTLLLQ